MQIIVHLEACQLQPCLHRARIQTSLGHCWNMLEYNSCWKPRYTWKCLKASCAQCGRVRTNLFKSQILTDSPCPVRLAPFGNSFTSSMKRYLCILHPASYFFAAVCTCDFCGSKFSGIGYIYYTRYIHNYTDISYHIISYHTIPYHIISYHITYIYMYMYMYTTMYIMYINVYHALHHALYLYVCTKYLYISTYVCKFLFLSSLSSVGSRHFQQGTCVIVPVRRVGTSSSCCTGRNFMFYQHVEGE